MSEENNEEQESKKLAMSSPIWMTLFVGLVMFLVGAAAGYFGRPLLAKEDENNEVAAVEAPANVASAADTQEMMDFLIEETRHFVGDPDAAVTIIEFSDFQ